MRQEFFGHFHCFWQVAGIDKDIVTAGFYANTELSPQVYSLSVLSIKSKLQEYIKSRVGSAVFQRYFADWAGHNCANMDYLTREQVGKIADQFCKKNNFVAKIISVRARTVGDLLGWGLVRVQTVCVGRSQPGGILSALFNWICFCIWSIVMVLIN